MDFVITDVQILGCIVCAVLSLIAYKCRYPSVAVIPAIGLFILGFEIYTASDDLLILGLFFMLAVVQFVICFDAAHRR